mmetsp:Transcript_38159/g.62955  ORF Transcript_38159/g.62955 Transcript_38159/m.62955 type:complete len:100 (-) Transcript_38159:21-320(-)
MNEWPALNLPREKVLLVLVDNAGYCALAFTAHLQAFFPNAKLRTCWGHTGNRFGAAMLEHPDMAGLRDYLKYMHPLCMVLIRCLGANVLLLQWVLYAPY